MRTTLVAAAAALVLAPVMVPTAPADTPGAKAQAVAPAIAEGPAGRVPINGPWVVHTDRLDHGLAKGWQTGAFDGDQETVPYAPDAGVVTGAAGLRNFRGNIAWYRTTIAAPADGVYALHFESVHHKATVWLDGRRLGEHTGVYLPFEFRIPLTAGQPHTLVVRADWRGPYAQKRAAWHRTWFNFGGINREVTLRPVGASDLTGPTFRTRLRDGLALVDVSVHVHNYAADRAITVQGTLVHGDQRIPVTFPSQVIRHNGSHIVRAEAAVPDPALWAPGSPNLYDLELSVPGEATYTTKVGLRELTWDGPRLFLNGQRIFLRGASIQEDVRGRGDALTPADMDTLVSQLKSIGANATRSQHPLNPALLERLDAAGILVWLGIGPVDAPGAWTSKTPKLQGQSRGRVRQNYLQAQTHPSVIAWNLANEVAGNGHPGGQAAFISQMARELHDRDPGRLVALDVWGAHPPKVAGPMYDDIDAIGATNYVGWYEDTYARGTRLADAIKGKVRLFERVFHGKVLAITEFGAEASARNATDLPGGYGFQARLLGLHIRTYKAFDGLSGALVWDLRDFAVSPAFAGGSIRKFVKAITITRGLNQKGLLTYSGRPKPAAAVVRREFLALGR
jgi:beta-galactosidase/beta-glucuronidase